MRKTEDPTPTQLTPRPGFQDRSPFRYGCFIFLIFSGGQGTRTLIPTFVGNCVSSAAQQTDICLSSGARDVKGSECEKKVSPSHVFHVFHISQLSASSRTRTSTFSLEDCNATVTPYSPFNVGRTNLFSTDFPGFRPKKSAHIFLYPGWDSNPHCSRSERDASCRLGYLGIKVSGLSRFQGFRVCNLFSWSNNQPCNYETLKP